MSRTLDALKVLVARGEVVGSSHGYEQLDEDAILFADLETSMPDAEPIEDYPDDAYGPSVLACIEPRTASCTPSGVSRRGLVHRPFW